MSDYLTELRRDLVDAHGRHGRRGRLGRAARVAHPRAWRPGTAVRVPAVVACVAIVVLVAGTLREPESTATLRVVTVVELGGQPVDATLAGGSLWVADYSGAVIRVDRARREVRARVRLGRAVRSIAATAAGVWVATEPDADDSGGGRLVRLDPRTAAIDARLPLVAWGAALASGQQGLWSLDNQNDPELPPRVRRLDPVQGATLTSASNGSTGVSIAVAPDAVWTLARDGAVTQLDPRTGRAVLRVSRVGDVADNGENALAADARGAWVVNPGEGAVLHIQGGRVRSRIAVDGRALPVLARSGEQLWVATQDTTRDGYHLARIDAESSDISATVDLGMHRPNTLLPAPGGLWVVADDGTALLIRAAQP